MCRMFGLLWAGMASSFAFHLYMRLEVFGQCPYPITGRFSNQPHAVAYRHKNTWQVYVSFLQFRSWLSRDPAWGRFVELQGIVEDTVYCTMSDVKCGIHVHNNAVVFPNCMLSLTSCQHCYNCMGLASQVTSVILDEPFLIFLFHVYTSCVTVLQLHVAVDFSVFVTLT
jgi:hypothetical protein